MGAEHYLVCQQCKQYINLYKARFFQTVISKDMPPTPTYDTQELGGGYWESRGLWFLWQHRSHTGIEMHTDDDEDWYNVIPYLNEIFPGHAK